MGAVAPLVGWLLTPSICADLLFYFAAPAGTCASTCLPSTGCFCGSHGSVWRLGAAVLEAGAPAGRGCPHAADPAVPVLRHHLHCQSGRLLLPALWRGVWPAAGCPLSTTLFNLLIWDLPQRLRGEERPGAGVPIGPPPRGGSCPAPLRVIGLGYADDAGLCGSAPEELQQLPACYCDYCGRTGCW
jgi:hypothetical protein